MGIDRPDSAPRVEKGEGFDVWESDAVGIVLQASVGLLGPELLGVSVEVKPQRVVIHACISEDNHLVDDDLSELVSDVESATVGLLDKDVVFEVVKYLGDTDEEWPGYLHRRIYLMNDRMREKLYGG